MEQAIGLDHRWLTQGKLRPILANPLSNHDPQAQDTRKASRCNQPLVASRNSYYLQIYGLALNDVSIKPSTFQVGKADVEISYLSRSYLADAHGLRHSQLVRYLLRYGLTAIASGALPINKRPVKWELVADD